MYSNTKASNGKEFHSFLKQMEKNIGFGMRVCSRQIPTIAIVSMHAPNSKAKEPDL